MECTGELAAREGSLCAWDGRLDNREDLILQLGKGLAEDPGDGALALQIYLTRGTDGLRDLVGDWSLAIWDARSRSVVLASDFAGVRPLYYHYSHNVLAWSSSLADLIRRAGSQDLDEEYAASFLAHGRAAHRTPYRNIYPVPPGQAVSVEGGRIVLRRFWALPVDQEIRYADERSYGEQLRVLFREAVAARLRTGLPACAELSGGLDSSSVVAMANRVLGGNAADPSQLVTLTYTHKNCPDMPYVRVMERARGAAGIHLELDTVPFIAAEQTGEAAPGWWQPRFRELHRRIQEMGSPVFLTGQLGDFIMGNSVDDYEQAVDLIERRQYGRALRETFAWSRSLQVPIYPLLWRSLRTAYSRWTAPVTPDRSVCLTSRLADVDSLTPELRRRLALWEEKQQKDAGWAEARPSRRRRFRALSEMLEARILQAPEPLQEISYTHPFAHRPLVEFMLAIPRSVICRPGEPRRLMRQAFAGLLPPAIVNRKSKAGYSGEYRKALRPLALLMLKDPRKLQLVERGIVEPDSIRSRLTAFTQNVDCNEAQLRQLILFEFWLRNRFGGTSSSTEPWPGPVGMREAWGGLVTA